MFSNADGAYGSNVNLLIDSGRWESEDDLAEQFVRRKGFAYGVKGRPVEQAALMQRALASATLTFQNLESVELGTTDIDQYVESLGGLNRAITRARGAAPATYIGDHTGQQGRIRTLEEQVALETRTRLLNPKWYEAQLKYGYEGVRNVAGHVSTTFGWSATGSARAPVGLHRGHPDLRARSRHARATERAQPHRGGRHGPAAPGSTRQGLLAA